ncbi:hypothetical protein Aple_075060 [Acrocarpospora pleiomorpha]|uniref:Thioesterase domain-containing protein n=1 Tax=Acrocarpospora pleiomorpha TaxID=90975 RepID=A0A5M3XTM9_9ACTN|nr:hypothetical protein Aple_075060 [Acrocarpospora pleiomorpha]
MYGGHTIALAAAQLNRTVPSLVTISSWKRCDHVGPVYEGDTLRSSIEVQAVRALGVEHLDAVDMRLRVSADEIGTAQESNTRAVLDWQFTAVVGHA